MLAVLALDSGLISASSALIVVVAAFFGATLESYLGATVEAIERVDNELVNFINTVVVALVAGALFTLLA